MQIPRNIEDAAIFAVNKTNSIISLEVGDWKVIAFRESGGDIFIRGTETKMTEKTIKNGERLTSKNIYDIIRPAGSFDDFEQYDADHKLERSRTLREFFGKLGYDLGDWDKNEQIEMAKNLGLKHNV